MHNSQYVETSILICMATEGDSDLCVYVLMTEKKGKKREIENLPV